MPTVVLLDVSLSMSRTFSATSKTYLDVAVENIKNLLDHFSEHNKLEYVGLVVFSSLYEVLVDFTRDYALMKTALGKVTPYDKTVIETALQGLQSCVTDEWGLSTPVNVILITDGCAGIGEGSLKESLSTINERTKDNKFPLPFNFPCELSIVCMNKLEKDKNLFEELIRLNYSKGHLYIPESLTEKSIQVCFESLHTVLYDTLQVTLQCGSFESLVSITPPPSFNNTSYSTNQIMHNHIDKDIDFTKLKFSNIFKIVGFLDLQDLSTPPFISRHLLVPVVTEKEENKGKEGGIGFQPSFCVLLHGSLKMEKMAALVQLGEEWYGMLYSWSDNKKKSSLMLSVFIPGKPFSWCGKLKDLGPAYELPSNPYRIDLKDNTEESPFPVAPVSRKSYHTQTNAVWIKQSGLQSDIQKLIRYAKKLPDKQGAFFKEVNKIRRAGVIYGFHDLLYGLANTLEQEGSNMTAEVTVQLRHVAEGLRNAPNRDLNKNIIAINMFRKKTSDS